MTIGERIRNRRIELGLSQEELGKRLGVTRSSICKVEKDKEQNLTTDRVSAYAKALQCTEADLMGWTSQEKRIAAYAELILGKQLAEDFDTLTEEQKKQIVMMIAFFKEQNKEK